MGFDAVWQQFFIGCYQAWVWLKYEASVHPFLFLGAALVVVAAWILYKAEIETK